MTPLSRLVQDDLGVWRRLQEDVRAHPDVTLVRENQLLSRELEEVRSRLHTEEARSTELNSRLKTALARMNNAVREARESASRIAPRRKQSSSIQPQLDAERARSALLADQLGQAKALAGDARRQAREAQASAARAAGQYKQKLAERDKTILGLQQRHVAINHQLMRFSGLHDSLRQENLRLIAALNPPSVKVSVETPPPPTVTYALLNSWNLNTLVGATTSEPPDQKMIDVYRLLAPIIGHLIGTTGLPMSLGSAASGRTISVPQGSNADIALAGFPTFVKRVS